MIRGIPQFYKHNEYMDMTHADSHSKEKFADLACRQGSLSFLGYIERASSFCLGRVIEIVTYKCINNGGKSDVTINPTCHVSNIYAVDESLLSILDSFFFYLHLFMGSSCTGHFLIFIIFLFM
ncbi:hypothetical protein BDV30DRAFT_125821 [Aspergillus minisclerotigenes]|uniref:Uncharacterized protein n=1 Tax=Aspergillus minisclerotigenes TaxID=656917 RepID=A0A5N6J2V4_9EURO|nr:hypothetical protein BDV30DRAFT_125821 [Aspergillus minisclerotigenes]